METSFWHQRWKDHNIGFHQDDANHQLVKYFSALCLKEGGRIFVPLCGKTLDIAWLLSKGYRVAGAELSKTAIEQLFTELKIDPSISTVGKLEHYSAENIDIFVGDIFNLSQNILGTINATYDRAALVALPKDMRKRYSTHLMEITNNAPQLLLCFEYNQSKMDGPPFSINNAEVNQHYGDRYNLTFLESTDLPGGIKGKYAAKENIWLLESNRGKAR
ncbi:MAG: thiopurine S-methyltransferase [Zetaproteobacteria bacterium]|nr:MAG: thiopurine S-methyltransferase [Zetaproteobacteria bacterium]